jgi:peptidoglycan hydrolase CwlO-like protein
MTISENSLVNNNQVEGRFQSVQSAWRIYFCIVNQDNITDEQRDLQGKIQELSTAVASTQNSRSAKKENVGESGSDGEPSRQETKAVLD